VPGNDGNDEVGDIKHLVTKFPGQPASGVLNFQAGPAGSTLVTRSTNQNSRRGPSSCRHLEHPCDASRRHTPSTRPSPPPQRVDRVHSPWSARYQYPTECRSPEAGRGFVWMRLCLRARLNSRLIHVCSPRSGLRRFLTVTSGSIPRDRSRTSPRGA
jgi:hypothetical protein